MNTCARFATPRQVSGCRSRTTIDVCAPLAPDDRRARRVNLPHVLRRYERVPADVVAGYRGIGTATVHEAQGKRGAMAAAIKPISDGMTLVGTALTVQCQAGDNLMLHKALEIVAPGEVIVCEIGG